ncbi:MAG: 3-deoxy-7-phosphoheptulonate synthase [Lachnospiraceae bacterium]|nr:3-deoxy-7-phosphoheptulonate synthase [Lachnospiraceae bacterium]
MSMNFVKKLLIPAEVKKQYPLPQKVVEAKQRRDTEIRDVITGKSDKFLVIIGPCSADSPEPVMEYVYRLAAVQEKVSDRLILIPRIYTNKPRTTGEGYKGMIHQPDPEKQPDVFAGLVAVRSLHTRVIEETGLTSADEMLYPENYRYLDDLLSYVAIGARSVEDQHHRMTVSGMDVPAGMKNPTSGDLSVLLNSVVAAQAGHTFIYRGWEVNTTGNPLAHVVLRGATNKHGNAIPNYHYEDLILLHELYEKRDLANPAVVIDTNHSNSGKQYLEQIRIVEEVLHSRSYSPQLKTLIKGFMIESYLEDGAQKIGSEPHVYGKSITDPCLGWEKSEKLIYEIYKKC